jgi:predicted RND superfamily exporter protein
LERFAGFVIRHALAVLAALLGLTIVAVVQIVDVRSGAILLGFDPSVSSLFPKESPGREYYEYIRRLFGSDETLVLAIVDDEGIFTYENLSAVKRMSERIEMLDGVHHVTGLANAINMRAVGGDLEVAPFITNVPRDPAELERIRREAFDNPIYAGNQVNLRGTATALFIYLEEMTDAEFLELDLDHRIEAVAEEERGGARTMLAGGSVLKAENVRIATKDVVRTTPLVAMAMALIAFLAFRNVIGVLVPLTTIGLALAWTLGLISASGRPLTMITLTVPAIVQTVGFAYAIHVVSAYYEQIRERSSGGGPPRGEAARVALAEVALPVLLTGLTTVVGFLSLTLSPLEAVREFGVFCVFAVVFSVVATLAFPAAILTLLPEPQTPPADEGRDRFGDAMARLAAFDLRNRHAIIAVAVVLAGIALLGVTRIRVGMDQVSVFPEGHPVRVNFHAINEQLEGSSLFYVVLETDYRDAFKEPVNLAEIARLQAWLGSQPEVGGTTSLVDYVSLINRGFHENDPAYLKIPESKRLISQLLFFGGNEELEKVVDSRYQTTSIVVRSQVVDTSDVFALIQRIEGRLAELPDHLTARITGNQILVGQAQDALSRGQAVSLSMAFILIYVILTILFTSFRVGALALVPNAFPVVIFFGTLGLTGITLNPSTSLVACIVLGIAVDDTIHFLARFNASAKRLADERKGAIEALRHVGRPVTYTTTALCLGFLVLCTSDMQTQVQFGALASFTLLVAWLVDVTLTPALSSQLRIVSLWDILSLDLGRDPARSIPLFSGLRNSQARIVALMTSIRHYTKGQSIMKTGESGDDMYVVLDGELAVCLRADEGLKEVARLERGDAVGEVALFSGTRSADVMARSDVRLLRFTKDDLMRLRRRYPRIGAQVLENLSEILAERVMEANRARAEA